ncbi:MAG: ltrA [Paenibacillus sp.]|jgi:hypothetical protein|nr:ltrA [Paenibacillus sp.]
MVTNTKWNSRLRNREIAQGLYLQREWNPMIRKNNVVLFIPPFAIWGIIVFAVAIIASLSWLISMWTFMVINRFNNIEKSSGVYLFPLANVKTVNTLSFSQDITPYTAADRERITKNLRPDIN